MDESVTLVLSHATVSHQMAQLHPAGLMRTGPVEAGSKKYWVRPAAIEQVAAE